MQEDKKYYGFSNDDAEPMELKSLDAVSDYIIEYGGHRCFDVTITDSEYNVLCSTFGIFLNKVTSMDFRSKLMETLLPKQLDFERSIGIEPMIL